MGSFDKSLSHKIILAILLLALATVLAQVAGAYFLQPKAVMHLNGERFEIRIADSERTRKKGLSGTSDLPADQAMVFVFDHDSRHGIWMKDMNYSIDIVWLNSLKRVVHIETQVSPDSYPAKSFFPKTEARYVVEFRSGAVKDKGIRVGQEAIFSGTDRSI